jgi:hypothetical protein
MNEATTTTRCPKCGAEELVHCDSLRYERKFYCGTTERACPGGWKLSHQTADCKLNVANAENARLTAALAPPPVAEAREWPDVPGVWSRNGQIYEASWNGRRWDGDSVSFLKDGPLLVRIIGGCEDRDRWEFLSTGKLTGHWLPCQVIVPTAVKDCSTITPEFTEAADIEAETPITVGAEPDYKAAWESLTDWMVAEYTEAPSDAWRAAMRCTGNKMRSLVPTAVTATEGSGEGKPPRPPMLRAALLGCEPGWWVQDTAANSSCWFLAGDDHQVTGNEFEFVDRTASDPEAVRLFDSESAPSNAAQQQE